MACMEKHKSLGRLISDEKYYAPPDVDASLLDLANDLCKIEKGHLHETHKW